jgi:hypothetical protein
MMNPFQRLTGCLSTRVLNIRRVGVLSHQLFPLKKFVLFLSRLLAEETEKRAKWHAAPIDRPDFPTANPPRAAAVATYDLQLSEF